MKKKCQRLAGLLSLLLAVILVFTGCSTSGSALNETTQKKSDQREVVQQENSEQEIDNQLLTSQNTNRLEVHFIDVGQADAILVRCGDQSMLVDAGSNDSSASLTAYLESCGVTDLTYVIGTHPHEDHIGGLDEVIDHFAPDAVIMPDKEHTTAAFEDVLTAIEENEVDLYRPQLYDEYQLGEATFTIIAPDLQGTIVAVSDGQSISFYTNVGEDTYETEEHAGSEESKMIEGGESLEESKPIEESDTSAFSEETSYRQDYTVYPMTNQL